MVKQRLIALAEAVPELSGAGSSPLVAELRAVKSGKQPQTLFDVARTFSRRVPLGRLLQIEPDIRPYLAAVLVAAVQEAGETLKLPAGMSVEHMADDDFRAHVLRLAAGTYNHYGVLGKLIPEATTEADLVKLREAQRDAQMRALVEEVSSLSHHLRAVREVV